MGDSLLATPLSATVTVVSVEKVARASCGDFGDSSDPVVAGATKRITLRTDDAGILTMYARIPGLPDDVVQPGESLDLSLEASTDGGTLTHKTWNQTFGLAKSGKTLLFVSTLNLFGVSVPDLSRFGLTAANEGASCQTSPTEWKAFSMRITSGTESVIVDEGQTVRIGPFSFTLDTFADLPLLDAKGMTQLGGFAVSPTP